VPFALPAAVHCYEEYLAALNGKKEKDGKKAKPDKGFY
jgi:hypothetical protein